MSPRGGLTVLDAPEACIEQILGMHDVLVHYQLWDDITDF